jgi:tRNA pseudouridine(38-40) synthase
MTRFALTLEWNGQPYMGFQRQAHGPSVQQAVEEAAFAVTGQVVTLHAAGRTDTGVHALAMRAHFDLARDFDAFRLSEALNARLRLAGTRWRCWTCGWSMRTGTRAFRAWGGPMNTASPTAARR